MTIPALFFICVGLLGISLAGSYLIWCFSVFCNAEHEFDLVAGELEQSVADCLAAFDACNFVPDSGKAIAVLIEQYRKEDRLPALEKEYKTIEALFRRLSRFAFPGVRWRVLRCHERLLRLEWAIDACNFPTVCNRIAGWIPDDKRRLEHLCRPL